MSAVSPGIWHIQSIIVKSGTVINYDGFEELQVSNDQISICPLGMDFAIEEASPRCLILSSQGDIYFADIRQQAGNLELTLTRPKFSAKVVMSATAKLSISGDGNHQTREVVQV